MKAGHAELDSALIKLSMQHLKEEFQLQVGRFIPNVESISQKSQGTHIYLRFQWEVQTGGATPLTVRNNKMYCKLHMHSI